VATVVDGKSAFEIAFAEVIVLSGVDGRGVVVGLKVIGIVADHAAKIGDHVGGEGVLIADDAHGFVVAGVLKLRVQWSCGIEEIFVGSLLDLFVGNFVAGEFVADAEAEAVAGGKIAVVTDGEIADGTGVGKVLRDNGVEIVAGLAAVGGNSKIVFSPAVLELSKTTSVVKTAPG